MIKGRWDPSTNVAFIFGFPLNHEFGNAVKGIHYIYRNCQDDCSMIFHDIYIAIPDNIYPAAVIVGSIFVYKISQFLILKFK